MLTSSPTIIVHLCDGVTDLRKSFEGLKLIIREKIRADPRIASLPVLPTEAVASLKMLPGLPAMGGHGTKDYPICAS